MKKNVLLFCILAMVSCSPVTYHLAVDVKKPAEFKIDLKGCPPSVVTICDRSTLDSAFASKMGVGVAEQIERSLSLEEGSIPVYTMFSDEVNTASIDDMAYLLTTAGSDRVVILDSLTTSDFMVEHPLQKEYDGTRLLSITEVQLPFTMKLRIAGLDSLLHGTAPFEASSVISQALKWTFLSDNYMMESKAISKALNSAPKVFHDMGGELGLMFFPQWEEEKRMIISFEGTDWDMAYRYARDFKWSEAMKIWMVHAGSQSPKKASYAAYNMAVACELMEQYDLALEWLELARGKYSFYELSLEKTNVENAMKKIQ